MPRCELTGKMPLTKHLVSHSNIKTKSVTNPNIQQKRIFSPTLNQMVNLKVAVSTLKDLEHRGGFDQFLLNQPDCALSARARSLKTRMLRKLRGQGKKKKSS